MEIKENESKGEGRSKTRILGGEHKCAMTVIIQCSAGTDQANEIPPVILLLSWLLISVRVRSISSNISLEMSLGQYGAS